MALKAGILLALLGTIVGYHFLQGSLWKQGYEVVFRKPTPAEISEGIAIANPVLKKLGLPVIGKENPYWDIRVELSAHERVVSCPVTSEVRVYIDLTQKSFSGFTSGANQKYFNRIPEHIPAQLPAGRLHDIARKYRNMFEDKWLVFQKDEFKDVFLSSVDPRQQKLARPKFFWSTYHAMPYGYRTRDMDAGMGVTVNAYTGKIMDLSHYVATFDPPVKKLTRAQAETKAQEFLTDYRNRFPIKGKDYFGYARGQFLNGSHPLLAYVRGNHNYEGPNELYTHPPRPRPDLLAHGRLAHCFLIGKDVIWIDAENGKVLGGWP